MLVDFLILFVYILLKKSVLMINEQECKRILDEGDYKFTLGEMLQIRELITNLAKIEFDAFKQNQDKSIHYECNSLHEGKYRRAS